MKKQSNYKIIIALAIIAAILFVVWYLVYKPNFPNAFSNSNAEWGGFGDFFWGLGIMLLTGLNVYVFYKLTIVYGNAEVERNKSARELQQRQFEFTQKMAIIESLRSIIAELITTNKISKEMRTKIYYTLNTIKLLRNLYSDNEIERQATDLGNKVFHFEDEQYDAWKIEHIDGQMIYIPIDKRFADIVKGLGQLTSSLWKNLDEQINQPK